MTAEGSAVEMNNGIINQSRPQTYPFVIFPVSRNTRKERTRKTVLTYDNNDKVCNLLRKFLSLLCLLTSGDQTAPHSTAMSLPEALCVQRNVRVSELNVS